MTCKSTNVEARNDLSGPSGIVRGKPVNQYIPKVQHAGMITHTCILSEGHKDLADSLGFSSSFRADWLTWKGKKQGSLI